MINRGCLQYQEHLPPDNRSETKLCFLDSSAYEVGNYNGRLQLPSQTSFMKRVLLPQTRTWEKILKKMFHESRSFETFAMLHHTHVKEFLQCDSPAYCECYEWYQLYLSKENVPHF